MLIAEIVYAQGLGGWFAVVHEGTVALGTSVPRHGVIKTYPDLIRRLARDHPKAHRRVAGIVGTPPELQR